ncbi:hypothetical protein DCC79_05110 [bacterium]|nr:hypothetical protein [Chloroflexi bacterium CFX6]RIL11361.1 MAG: hypothetical protein DCC79_05110 [bacterium]
MTTSARLTIELHGYWHAGSGRGDGHGADAAVVRTPGGLPYLPGRTVKGLLRDAAVTAEALGRCPRGSVRAWFGSPLPEPEEDGTDTSFAAEQTLHRYTTDGGSLRVSSARLGASRDDQRRWEAWAGAALPDDATIAQLYRTVSSTALEQGVALANTLRVVEVTVPVTLHACIDGPDDPAWIDLLAANVLPLIRRLGKGRTRGLGACTWSLDREGGQR